MFNIRIEEEKKEVRDSVAGSEENVVSDSEVEADEESKETDSRARIQEGSSHGRRKKRQAEVVASEVSQRIHEFPGLALDHDDVEVESELYQE